MPLPKSFPTPAEQTQMKDIRKYRLLYENHQKEVLGLHQRIKDMFKSKEDIIYVAHSIPARISDFYGDFVTGDADNIVIATTGKPEEQEAIDTIVDYNDIRPMISDIAVDQSSIGFHVILIRQEDENIIWDAVPQDQYFPQADGSVIFVSYVTQPNTKYDAVTGEPLDLWLYAQHYKLENGTCKIYRNLYAVKDVFFAGDEIPLNKFDKDLEQVEDLGINVIPVVQIDNGRKKIRRVGRSDYADILPQLSEINEKSTQVSIQLLDNLNPIKTAPKGALLDDNGDAKNATLIELDKEDPDVKIVSNANALITETFSYIEKEAQFISLISSVPLWEILSNSSQPDRVESLKIKLYAAIRKAKVKRTNIRKGVDWALRISLMFKGIKEPSKIQIKFDDPLPIDPINEANVEQVKLQNGLTSRRSAMKRLDGLDDGEVDKELELIANEEARAGIFPAGAPPTIDINEEI